MHARCSAFESTAALARGPLVGTFLGLILYGVTCMQAFFYFRAYAHDTWALKATVALLVALESIHAAMTMWVMDDYLIVNYGNPSALQAATWSSTVTYILGLLIDFYVYLYFTWRIWLFTKRSWIIVLMCALSISRTAISIISSVYSVLKPSWHTYLHSSSSKTLLIVGNVLFIAGDTFSAGVMAYQLNKFKSWTHAHSSGRPRRMDNLLNRLLIFAVATGALTSLVDLIALILTLARPHTLAFLSAILVQTRLYANSLLASLNIRDAVSRSYEDDGNGPIELPVISLRFARPSNLSASEDGAAQGRADDVSKTFIESWQTAHAQD